MNYKEYMVILEDLKKIKQKRPSILGSKVILYNMIMPPYISQKQPCQKSQRLVGLFSYIPPIPPVWYQ